MALDNRDDNLERDPRTARLLEAAGGEEPPAALDAAILAAARREVSARPQVAGGGAATGVPPLRAKRNWYVPVSIAAVLVLSVSLVTLVHEEKGDQLAQPPRTASAPSTSSAPAPAADAPMAKPDAMVRDAAPEKPKVTEDRLLDATIDAQETKAPATPEAYAELAKKQRAEKREAADGAVVLDNARKDQAAGATARQQQGPASDTAALKSVPGAVGGMAAGVPARERRPEPFSAAGEREAPAPAASAPATVPAQAAASRDAAEARARSEADRSLTRGAIQEAPAVLAAPPAPPARAAAAPRRAAPTDDLQTRSAPALAQVESRALATLPPAIVAAKPSAPPPPAKPVVPQRLPAWRGLEDQPPEKWLARLVEFKRDNRQADADELLAEFRRRFPDHPASAR